MPIEDSSQIKTLIVIGDLDLSTSMTELRFDDGRAVRVPTALLKQGPAFMDSPATSLSTDGALLISLVEEQLQVSKRIVETGKVYLQKSSEAYEVTLNEALAVSTWKVERVPMHEVVTEAPSARQEGSTTIYPLIEERLVMTKELVLVEEIHVTQEVFERREPQTLILRRETLSVERESLQQS